MRFVSAVSLISALFLVASAQANTIGGTLNIDLEAVKTAPQLAEVIASVSSPYASYHGDGFDCTLGVRLNYFEVVSPSVATGRVELYGIGTGSEAEKFCVMSEEYARETVNEIQKRKGVEVTLDVSSTK